MIINGGAAGNVGWWGKHLEREDTNDRAEVVEVSGLLATDLPTALREMQAIAAQSRSHGNFMYQANINPEAHEHLTPEQWREAVDTLEKNLGLEGHQRVVVEHEKHGRIHRHIVWNRVDVETLRVTDIGGNYYTHERTARELEGKFDLTPTPSLHGQQRPEGRPDRAPELWEQRAAERSGIDPKQITAELTELWRASDNGKAFAAAIEERGYILAQGTRRDFCIIDHAGDVHSLARRIEGAKTKDVRERLDHIDDAALPTVDEARTQQREKYPTHEAARAAWEGRAGTAAQHRQGKPELTPTVPIEDINARHSVAERERQQRQPSAEFWKGVQDRRDERQGKTQKAWSMNRDAEVARVTDAASPRREEGGLRVADAATGVVSSLGSFVDSLLGGNRPQPTEETERFRAQRRALDAMESIRESLERGENLSASDVAALTPSHLMNIKAKGDDGIREMVERTERDRARRLDYGRERER